MQYLIVGDFEQQKSLVLVAFQQFENARDKFKIFSSEHVVFFNVYGYVAVEKQGLIFIVKGHS